MKKVYLDNASTTALRPDVLQVMVKVLAEDFGNPSSSHSFGRNSKNIVELSRKEIAKELNCSANEIIFTSGGTEANNWVLRSAIKDLKVKRIITSKIEHHAVLHTLEALQKEFGIQVDYVALQPNGTIDYTDLVELLSQNHKTLVSLMHVNNEIGTLLAIETVGKIAHQYQALFHSDTVQSIGKTSFDLKNLPIDFLVASAHKFHGPKGIGFAYVRKNSGIQPLLFGGEQEKGLRPGTEAVHQIAGMSKALSIAMSELKTEQPAISEIKKYAISRFEIEFPDFQINGQEDGFYTILNISLPLSEEKNSLLLFHLDMKGIAISRGSACQSGSSRPSHVLAELLSPSDLKKPSLRISLSHDSTKEDIDALITALKQLD